MHRTSTRLLAAALIIAIVALALTMYESSVRRAFSEPSATTIGKVIRHSNPRRSRTRGPGMFCWVSYEFTPAEGGPRREGWSLWRDACGLKTGGPVPVQYVIANPDINRAPDGGLPVSPLLLWFGAGILIVIGIIRRGSETDE
jgi:hypothetical protein